LCYALSSAAGRESSIFLKFEEEEEEEKRRLYRVKTVRLHLPFNVTNFTK